MDNDPSDILGRALARDINGLLELDGVVMNDREIIIPPEMTSELDVTDIVIGRNDDYRRTVCHVHRPPTDDYYWRHETYVAWDDGRTAWFYINIALDEAQQQVKETLRTRHHELLGQFELLIYRNVITKPEAEAMYDGILTELENVTEQVNEALLKGDVADESPSPTALRAIIEQVDAESPVGEASDPAYEKLYEVVRNLRTAHYASIELRTNLVEQYVTESSRRINEAESDRASSAPSPAIWDLLELLDRLRSESSA